MILQQKHTLRFINLNIYEYIIHTYRKSTVPKLNTLKILPEIAVI